MKRLEMKVIELPFTYNVFDFEEYLKLIYAKAGRTEIEISLHDCAYNNIPLLGGINSDEYSYVIALHVMYWQIFVMNIRHNY